MTHTKVPGNSSFPLTGCLLPTGSACEPIHGISHLFEHILVTHLDSLDGHYILKAHTTEDYIFIAGHTSKDQILQSIKSLELDQSTLLTHKEQIKEEICKCSNYLRENFFSTIWQGTSYQRTPLGSVETIESITISHIQDLIKTVLNNPIFFYTHLNEVETNFDSRLQPSFDESISMVLPKPFTLKKEKINGERSYYIYFFNNKLEEFYLIQHILKIANPGKHIHLSEKRKMSALVFEEPLRIPQSNDLKILKDKALQEMIAITDSIKSNFPERALNEMESIYFYDKSWESRINRLFHISPSELIELISTFNS